MMSRARFFLGLAADNGAAVVRVVDPRGQAIHVTGLGQVIEGPMLAGGLGGVRAGVAR